MRFWFISAIHFFTIVACAVSFLVNRFNNGKTPPQFLAFRTVTAYYVLVRAFFFFFSFQLFLLPSPGFVSSRRAPSPSSPHVSFFSWLSFLPS